MAFNNTKERYASFGVATSLPHEIIDIFWELLDHYLKNVVPLDTLLTFQLIKHQGKLSFAYQDSKRELFIIFDYNTPYDPFYPETVNIVDDHGIETILLPHELN
ncbi:hypothetical protein DDV21_009025 [Streptococcus chenjunshii]|uniref:DUF960 domain-containing protein n=1 Tax=Streptococcus chenjunshii TaxID=2173853 RepID=A0A372KL12_9STRE|nr:DUF960 domain-containing protein [Streptococcus chenjunshii]AXQ79214.1 hypothetical protein DDV21_009025 [Streptococcus chenjunshii]RFU50786.1 hypothetical protein DDV22_07055 [Streptococcus chenjunshii]RFU52967.1 hypothetical protein DDV23_07135 [Streptococcus chenjunshii]